MLKRLAFAKPGLYLNVGPQTLFAIFVQFPIWTHLNSPTRKLCISHNTSIVWQVGETKTRPHQNLCYTVFLKQTNVKYDQQMLNMINSVLKANKAPIHPSTFIVFHPPQASVALFGPNFPSFNSHSVWIRLRRSEVKAKDFKGWLCVSKTAWQMRFTVWSASSCNGNKQFSMCKQKHQNQQVLKQTCMWQPQRLDCNEKACSSNMPRKKSHMVWPRTHMFNRFCNIVII